METNTKFFIWYVVIAIWGILIGWNLISSYPRLSWVLFALFTLVFFGLRYIFLKRLKSNADMMPEKQDNEATFQEAKGIETRFKDVAGADEAKAELAEIVDFLKEPGRYQRLGGRMPKGILLVGPPGTGKTLLARAVAGEANVPFLSISGSAFVEMYVGVGASRVRELFQQAREKAPCIVFIDELDGMGKARGTSADSADKEYEQTLNQLLVEMDGFDPSTGVVILAATNRPETLDPALLRAGRFDRKVLVDLPDVNGRQAIIRVHAKKVKLANRVDLKIIAQQTSGFSGADLANVINEAALLATRRNKDAIDMQDLGEAVDRSIAGVEKKTHSINPREKEFFAYHETGHSLIAAFTPGADKVLKISIIPRGVSGLGGYTQQLPSEDRCLMTRQELLGKIDVLLGGRMAEEIVFGDVSTGAYDDLQRATDIARAMVSEYGMGKTLGLTTLSPGQAQKDGNECSEATAAKLDDEVKALITERAAAVRELLSRNRRLLKEIAGELLKKEVLASDEFDRLVQAHRVIDKHEGGIPEISLKPVRETRDSPIDSTAKPNIEVNEVQIDMRIDGRMKVATFRSQFKAIFGVGVRVYRGKKFADNRSSLSNIRDIGSKGGTISIRANMKVGETERLFKDEMGMTIQIEDIHGELAEDNLLISELTRVKR